MSISKIYLLDELERIIKEESFSDNPKKTIIDESFLEKEVSPKANNYTYLVLSDGVNKSLLSKVLVNINLLDNVNYMYMDVSSVILNYKKIRDLIINGEFKTLLIIGEKAASKVFNRKINIENAKLKKFKYCGKEGMIISDLIIDNKEKKKELWNDLKTFAKWQKLEIK